MFDPTTVCLTVNANPDVSGIGVRIAIYAQNLLSFVPALWALKDGRISPTELDALEKQSTTILITAFAILISTVIQAHNDGISDYHASIVLDLSWMNNTNLFIYFLLYIYHRADLSDEEFDEEFRVSASHSSPTKGFARWIYETKKASKNSVIIIGSLHLSLMAAVGIWLWSYPASFGGSGLCSLSATISIFGKQVQLGSSGLRIWSILVYGTAVIPMLNLFIPIAFFAVPLFISKHVFDFSGNLILHSTVTGLGTLAAIDIILLVDTEVAIRNNRYQFQLASEAQWTFGQTLAVLLLLVALYSLIESILEKHARQLDEQLLEACKNGEIGSVKSLLSRGARKSVLNACVQVAIERDYLDIAEILLDQGNLKSNDFKDMLRLIKITQLHYAAEKGYVNVVQFLLKCNAKINAEGNSGKSSLHYAAENGHLEIVKTLLENNADVNLKTHNQMSPLHYAAEKGYLKIVNILLKNNANVNSQDNFNNSPLHYAAVNDYLNIVKVLLNNNADVNLKALYNGSPLHCAVEKGHLNIVEVLLDKNADVNVKHVGEKSPLHHAAENGYLEIVKILLKNNADVNSKTLYNDSPLHYAVQKGSLDIVKVLLNKNADVNVKNNSNKSPLHYAAENGHLEIVKNLLENNADVNLKTLYIESPLHFAVKNGHLDIVKFLLDKNADVNLKDNWDMSPLHYAVKRGYPNIVQVLLNKNADVNLKDKSGYPPLYYAAKNGHQNIVDILTTMQIKI